jgi:putative Mg2+ transporter-C (MgtC) family protein
MADLLNVDWMLTLNHLLLMAIAYLLAFPIGFDREVSTTVSFDRFLSV